MAVDIQSFRAQNPLEAVVQRFTGQEPVKHKIKAPWRDERTPSVHIYEDGKFKDFGGDGWHGDVIDFVGYYLFGTSYDPTTHFTEVIDKLGALDIAPLPARIERAKPVPPALQLNRADIERWHINMPPQRREYWTGRGLTDRTINNFELGWNGKRYTIPCFYRNVPFNLKTRIAPEDDQRAKQHREVERARLLAEQPDLDAAALHRQLPALPPKYMSLSREQGGRPGIFNADILAGTEQVVICEGEIDCMLLDQYDYPAITCTSGANGWQPEWMRLLSHVRQVWLLLDHDSAGAKGAQRLLGMMRRARIVRLPEGVKDVGELFDKFTRPCQWLDGVLV